MQGLNQTIDVREARLRDLMVAAQRGDSAAYERFLTELAGVLRALFRRRLTRWPDDVEDLVQETLPPCTTSGTRTNRISR